ncbi:hypothetical protein N7523_007434 [Penicillium sp. IBT 18751x]|nr:hypothetical protein N7523_007434 [Penicillium sp. IBT 18751x]
MTTASEFSTSQLSKYLKYICLPAEYHQYIESPESFPKTEEALTTLFRCQITRFPYDNLSVHDSEISQIDINPSSIYLKFMGPGVSEPSRRGGYCLECSIFFNHVLRKLGFSVYMTGVRNRERIDGIPQGEYRGWTHIVNIVELPSGVQYHVDVAFGGDGPTRPLPLVSGQVYQNLGSQEIRLMYGNIPKQTRLEQKLWIYQYRNSAAKDWNSFYSFGEFEFFQDDFEVINRYTHWHTLTLKNVWVVKFIRNGETNGLPLLEGEIGRPVSEAIQIVGKIMFVNGVVKLNMGGKTRVIDSYKTEGERREGLKKWFSISV